MSIAAVVEELFELVAPDAQVERIATGYQFTEGPIWLKDERTLLFTDITGDGIHQWKDHTASSWRTPSNKANGMTLDAQGRLIVCEHVTNCIARIDGDGRRTVLASHYGGKELNSPNDVVVKSDGCIYFTDPDHRSVPWGSGRPRELDYQGVFALPEGGSELVLLIDDFEIPNGLCFSPDETLLYINDSARFHIRVFDVQPDGTIANGRLFFTEEHTGNPADGTVDGMKTDVLGNVYVTGPRGVWVIGPDGRHLGIIETTERLQTRPDAPFVCDASNMNWGGDEWSTLFITATHSVYRVGMKVRGSHVPYMGRTVESNLQNRDLPDAPSNR